MKSVFLVLLLCFSYGIGLAADTVGDIDVAIALGRKEAKNVLLVFTLQNCQPCNNLKNSLSSIKYLDEYIVCLVDTKANKRLTGSYKVVKWPTSIVLTSSRENFGEVSRKIGFDNQKDYERWLYKNAVTYGASKCNCAVDCKCRVNGECKCSDKCECKHE